MTLLLVGWRGRRRRQPGDTGADDSLQQDDSDKRHYMVSPPRQRSMSTVYTRTQLN
jgi:hypothetical protein